MKRLLACLVLAALAAPATACLNEARLPAHEQQFRSSYKAAPAPGVVPDGYSSPLLAFAGAGLLVGAVGLALAAPRRGR